MNKIYIKGIVHLKLTLTLFQNFINIFVYRVSGEHKSDKNRVSPECPHNWCRENKVTNVEFYD